MAYLTGLGSAPWRFSVPADPLAAGAALALLAGLTTVRACGTRTNRTGFTWRRWRWGYWPYLRLLALGLAPFGVADTAVLMAAGYVAFLLRQFTASPPLYRLAMLLPLLAWRPRHGSCLGVDRRGAAGRRRAVPVAGRALRNPWPLYLGVLALNGAVYLWAPLWAGAMDMAVLHRAWSRVGAGATASPSPGIAAEGVEWSAVGGIELRCTPGRVGRIPAAGLSVFVLALALGA